MLHFICNRDSSVAIERITELTSNFKKKADIEHEQNRKDIRWKPKR